mgnify:CR=1 FL=1
MQRKISTIDDLQETVDNWVKSYGVRYFSELTNLAVLMEEVGELARIMSRLYGDQSFKRMDIPDSLADDQVRALYQDRDGVLRRIETSLETLGTDRARLDAMIEYIRSNFATFTEFDRQLILIAPSIFAEDAEQQREIGRALPQECRDRTQIEYAVFCLKKSARGRRARPQRCRTRWHHRLIRR